MTGVQASNQASGPDEAAQYRAARSGTIVVDRSDLGRLSIRGRDALELLHRLTTNQLRTLLPGEGAATVFTTAKGRIIDHVVVHVLEDEILCLTGPGRSTQVKDWIDRYTFREDVKVDDRSLGRGTFGIFGAAAARTIGGLWGEAAAGRPLHHAVRVAIAGSPAVLARTFPLAGEGYHLTAEAASLPALRDALLRTPDGPVAAGAACLEALRIEAGLPASGRELTEDYNPWEARLQDAISLDKGCYVGQEVIARLHTYKKVSKQLVRLLLEGSEVLSSGAPLLVAGQPVGTLTSVAVVPGEGRVVGLGYVRDEDAVAGKELVVGGQATVSRATIVGPAR
jgi:tRNA-modifying protein YgfZ